MFWNKLNSTNFNIGILFGFIIIISGFTVYFGHQPMIIEICPTYKLVDKELIPPAKHNKMVHLISLNDVRSTDIVDTFYSNVNPPLYWAIRSNVAEILSDALRLNIEMYGFGGTSDEASFYLNGEITQIELNVVQQFPEIIEATIQVNMVLNDTINNKTEWTKIITGKSSIEGRGELAANETKAINSAKKILLGTFYWISRLMIV